WRRTAPTTSTCTTPRTTRWTRSTRRRWRRTWPPTPCSPTWPPRRKGISAPRRRTSEAESRTGTAAMTSERYDEFGHVSQDPVSGVHRLGANGPSLTTALAAASATRRKVALLHIDIDMFRSINVNMGEEVGDQALAAIGQRLRQALPPDAWLWRRGSDEFVAGLGYREGEPDGTAVADALRDAFDTPLYLPPYTIPVTLSIGVAVFPDHARNSAELLARAEHALLQVKEEGLDSVALYEQRDARLPVGDGF